MKLLTEPEEEFALENLLTLSDTANPRKFGRRKRNVPDLLQPVMDALKAVLDGLPPEEYWMPNLDEPRTVEPLEYFRTAFTRAMTHYRSVHFKVGDVDKIARTIGHLAKSYSPRTLTGVLDAFEKNGFEILPLLEDKRVHDLLEKYTGHEPIETIISCFLYLRIKRGEAKDLDDALGQLNVLSQNPRVQSAVNGFYAATDFALSVVYDSLHYTNGDLEYYLRFVGREDVKRIIKTVYEGKQIVHDTLDTIRTTHPESFEEFLFLFLNHMEENTRWDVDPQYDGTFRREYWAGEWWADFESMAEKDFPALLTLFRTAAHADDGKKFWEEASAIGLQAIVDKYKKAENSSDLYTKLLQAGIPEEAIEANEELWDFLQDAKRNEIISQNRSFYVRDKDGNRLLLKITGNKAKARMEAAANYYLSSHLKFIAPGKFSEPLEANGLYLTLQKDISEETIETAAEMPLDYWIGAFALFHREAERILQEEGVNLREVAFKTADHESERYLRGRKNHELKLDLVRFEEAIDYLQTSSPKVLIHNDPKKSNLVGKYIVDLELCGRGHPAIDLALLFMQYGVFEAEWDIHLRKYLTAKGTAESYGDELKNLKEGMRHATHYTAVREIIGSSLREVRPETVMANLQLSSHLHR